MKSAREDSDCALLLTASKDGQCERVRGMILLKSSYAQSFVELNRVFHVKTKNSNDKMLPPVRIDHEPPIKRPFTPSIRVNAVTTLQ